MLDNYNFKDAQFDVKSLIHLFNLQGKDLIGLELGVLRAESFCSILQNCPNVKTLYELTVGNHTQTYLENLTA